MITEENKYNAINEIQFITASLRYIEDLIDHQIDITKIVQLLDELGYKIEDLKAEE